MLNLAILGGNLVADPELKQTKNSNSMGIFRIAVNGSGNNRNEVLYINVKCFGALAEAVMKKTRKGTLVVVEGRLVYNSFTKKDGTSISSIELFASNVQFLSNVGEYTEQVEEVGSYAPSAPKEEGQSDGDAPDDDLPW